MIEAHELRRRTRGAEDPLAQQRLRVWIRIIKISRGVASELRERLRLEFDATLPQFDLLAALYRYEKGMKMSALSKELMVSNGNVTGIVERLVEQGYVVRAPVQHDRRATVVRLTRKGRETFTHMAARHRVWVSKALSGLDMHEATAVIDLLDAARPGGRR